MLGFITTSDYYGLLFGLLFEYIINTVFNIYDHNNIMTIYAVYCSFHQPDPRLHQDVVYEIVSHFMNHKTIEEHRAE